MLEVSLESQDARGGGRGGGVDGKGVVDDENGDKERRGVGNRFF